MYTSIWCDFLLSPCSWRAWSPWASASTPSPQTTATTGSWANQIDSFSPQILIYLFLPRMTSSGVSTWTWDTDPTTARFPKWSWWGRGFSRLCKRTILWAIIGLKISMSFGADKMYYSLQEPKFHAITICPAFVLIKEQRVRYNLEIEFFTNYFFTYIQHSTGDE